MQKVFRLLNQSFEPPKPIIELNLQHPIIKSLLQLPVAAPLLNTTIELLYENALLMEGLHPDPSEIAPHIQTLIQLALEKQADE